MSNIGDAIDAIITIVQTDIFAGTKIQLNDAITIPNNTEGALTNGWGLRIGGAANTNRNISCKFSIIRDMTIILTLKTQSASQFRTEEKYDSSKVILEDHFKLVKHFEQEPTLLFGKILQFNFVSDPGIQNVFVEKINQSFIKIETLFRMEYLEDATT